MNNYTVYSSTNDDITGDFAENDLNLIVAQSAITDTLVGGLFMLQPPTLWRWAAAVSMARDSR